MSTLHTFPTLCEQAAVSQVANLQLWFSFQGAQYQYNRLPFGYFLATFSKCFKMTLEPLLRVVIRVLFYRQPAAAGAVPRRHSGADSQARRTPVSPGFSALHQSPVHSWHIA